MLHPTKASTTVYNKQSFWANTLGNWYYILHRKFPLDQQIMAGKFTDTQKSKSQVPHSWSFSFTHREVMSITEIP